MAPPGWGRRRRVELWVPKLDPLLGEAIGGADELLERLALESVDPGSLVSPSEALAAETVAEQWSFCPPAPSLLWRGVLRPRCGGWEVYAGVFRRGWRLASSSSAATSARSRGFGGLKLVVRMLAGGLVPLLRCFEGRQRHRGPASTGMIRG